MNMLLVLFTILAYAMCVIVHVPTVYVSLLGFDAAAGKGASCELCGVLYCLESCEVWVFKTCMYYKLFPFRVDLEIVFTLYSTVHNEYLCTCALAKENESLYAT